MTLDKSKTFWIDLLEPIWIDPTKTGRANKPTDFPKVSDVMDTYFDKFNSPVRTKYSDGKVTYTLEAPGLLRDSLEVSVTKANYLVIKYTTKLRDEKDKVFHYSRTLPTGYSGEDVKLEYVDGVIYIEVPLSGQKDTKVFKLNENP